jgi:hypothetical protein
MVRGEEVMGVGLRLQGKKVVGVAPLANAI